MESITITPRNKRQSDAIKSFFKEMDIPLKEKKESLEIKILRLYEEGHYDDEDIKWFFETPKEYRVDPFELSPSGDIHWADKRRVEKLYKDIEENKKEKEHGNYIVLDNNKSIWELI